MNLFKRFSILVFVFVSLFLTASLALASLNVNVTASPPSVPYNGSSTISWNATGSPSATYCKSSLGQVWNNLTQGSFSVSNLLHAMSYSVDCRNGTGCQSIAGPQYTNACQQRTTPGACDNKMTTDNPPDHACEWNGAFDSGSASVSVAAPVFSVNVTASPTSVSAGGTSSISWTSSLADSCTLSGGGITGSGTSNSGVSTNPLTNSTTYTVTCNRQVSVGSCDSSWGPVIDCWSSNVSPANNYGTCHDHYCGTSQFNNQTACNNAMASPGGTDPVQDVCNWIPANSQTTVTGSVTVVVLPVTCSSQANPATITSGGSSTISWTSTEASSCNSGGHGTGISGAIAPNTFTVSPTQTTTYPISCTRNAQTFPGGPCMGTYSANGCSGTVIGSICSGGGQAFEGEDCSQFSQNQCPGTTDPWCHHGCHWATGTSSCSDFTTSSQCNAHSPCTWGSGYTVPAQTVNCNATVNVTIPPAPVVSLTDGNGVHGTFNVQTGPSSAMQLRVSSSVIGSSCTLLRDGVTFNNTDPGHSLPFTNPFNYNGLVYFLTLIENSPSNHAYKVTCTNSGGSGSDTVNLVISATPLPDLVASPTSPNPPSITATVGVSKILTSTITNQGAASTGGPFSNVLLVASGVNGTGGILSNGTILSTPNPMGQLAANGTDNASGSYTFTSSGVYSYKFCTDQTSNSGGGVITESTETNNCSYWTTVNVSDNTPVVTLIADPTTGQTGISTTLTWTTTNSPTSCTASGDSLWTGSKNVNGASQLVGPLNTVKTYTFTLTCVNASGSGSDTAQVVVTASAPQTRTLTVNKTGSTGNGTVTSSPPGINCTPASSNFGCSSNFIKNTVVTLSAFTVNTIPQSVFVGWWQGGNRICQNTGSHCDVNMNADKTITAKFFILPTGTISAPNCVISAGNSECNSTVTWMVSNPLPILLAGEPAVTSNYPNNNYQVATGISGTQIVPIPYDSRDFFLYQNAILLDQVTPTASCAINTSWKVNKCVSDVVLPNLTATTPPEDTATVGTPKTFTSSIKNVSPTSTGISFINLFQVSPVPNPNMNTIVIDYPVSPEMPTLGGGLSTTTQKDITFTTPGHHYVRACADKSSAGDVNGKIPESDEDDNCSAWKQVNVARAPQVPTVEDPTVSNVVVDVAPNYKATLGATVTDKGYPADLSVRGTCYKLASSGPLPPNLTDGASICHPYQDTGPIPLTPFTHVQYSLLPNEIYVFNGYATNSTGTGYSNANYFPTGGNPTLIDLVAEDPTIINDNQDAGTFIKFTSMIRNDGADSTGGTFSNIFKVAEQAAGSGTKHIVTSTPQPMGSLNSQSHHLAMSSDFLLSGNPGTWSVQACADSVFQISETNETNNCSSWVNFTVNPGINVPGQCDILPYWCLVPLGFVNGTKTGDVYTWTCQGSPDDNCSYTLPPPIAGCLSQHFGCVSGTASNTHTSTGIGDPWTWECPGAPDQCSEIYVPSCPAHTHKDLNPPYKCICDNGAHNPPSCKGSTYIER